MDILGDEYFRQWVRSRNIRDSTIDRYMQTLKSYCLFLEKTPTTLIKEARDDQTSQPWISDRRINNYLLDYQDHIKDLSYNTVKNQLTVIKGFYHNYEIQVPRLVLKRNNQQHQLSTDLPGRDEIQVALRNCNIKYQSIILLQSSTGFGRGEIQHTMAPGEY